MKLIAEIVENVDYELIEEAAGKKSLYLTGVFMQSECVNRNGRRYPKGIMESAVSKYIGEKVNNKCAYGELSHPNSGAKINEPLISHMITELKWDGNDVMGKAKILDTPNGKTARAIIEGGGRLGVSSRGLGSLKPDAKGIQEVQSDYRLATAADIVIDPSAPSAWVNGILEGYDFQYDDKTGEYVANVKRQLMGMTTREIQERKFKLFESFIKSL